MQETMIELEEKHAIIRIPSNAVSLTVTAKVYHDDSLVEVQNKMSMQEIREAFEEYKAAEDAGYIPTDAVFKLTEEGLEYLEQLREGNVD